MGYANDGLRFLLELGALAALTYWGFSEFGGLAQWLLGLGTPLLAAVVWGRFVAPKASHPTVDPARLGLEVLVFGSGVAALFGSGRALLGLVYPGLVATTWHSRSRSASGRRGLLRDRGAEALIGR